MQHRARPRPTDATGGQRRSRPPPHGAPPAARRPPAPPDPDPAEGAGGCGAVRAGVHLRPLRSAVRGRRRDPPAGLCVPVTPPDPQSAAPSVPASVSPQLRGTVRGRRRDHARLKGRHPRPPPRRPPLSPRACRCTQSQRCQSRRAPPPEGSAVSVRPTPAPPRPHPRSAAVGRCLGGGGGRELKANLRGGLTGRKGRAPPAPLRGQRERRAKRYTLTGNLCAVPPLCGCPPRTPPSPFLRFHAPPAPRHRALQHPAVPQHPPPPLPPHPHTCSAAPAVSPPRRQPFEDGAQEALGGRGRGGGAAAAAARGGRRRRLRAERGAVPPRGQLRRGQRRRGSRRRRRRGGDLGGTQLQPPPFAPRRPRGLLRGGRAVAARCGQRCGQVRAGLLQQLLQRLHGRGAPRGAMGGAGRRGAARGGGSARARAPERRGGPGAAAPPRPARHLPAPGPGRSVAVTRGPPRPQRRAAPLSAVRPRRAHAARIPRRPPSPPPNSGVGKARGYGGG